jgi:hypothetical protein
MKRNFFLAYLIINVIVLASCAGRANTTQFIVPDSGETLYQENSISIENIMETKDGYGNANIPDWLARYITGGIENVEKMNIYQGKYCFIGRNESGNFEALNKWAENYSVTHDFSRLAAARIEKRLLASTSLYPDDEYGIFFEKMIKKAFDTIYTGAQVEDTFWIRKANDDDINSSYEFFIFISIDKVIMQNIINKMITEARADVTPTRAQANSINRLQQTFFEGF